MNPNQPMFSLLLVDDENQFLSFLKRTFAHEPYTVRVASNGLEALRLVENEQVDAMVVDLAMPKMDGLTVDFLEKSLTRQMYLSSKGGPLVHGPLKDPGCFRCFTRRA